MTPHRGPGSELIVGNWSLTSGAAKAGEGGKSLFILHVHPGQEVATKLVINGSTVLAVFKVQVNLRAAAGTP